MQAPIVRRTLPVDISTRAIQQWSRDGILRLVCILLSALDVCLGSGQQTGRSWEAKAEILEAWSCNVPCTCNFGGWPSPHRFCDSVAVFRFSSIKVQGSQLNPGAVALAGRANKKYVVFIQDGLPKPTDSFLEFFARGVLVKLHGSLEDLRRRPFKTETSENGLTAEVEGYARIRASYLQGNRPGTKIVVQNPLMFADLPISRTVKAETTLLEVGTEQVGFRYWRTKANHASVELTDRDLPGF